MGLFDWLSGLFSSKSDEENNDSENNKGSDDEGAEVMQSTYEETETQNQIVSDLIPQSTHETESNSVEADTRHAKDEA
ncbi:hypothetical protein Nit79A3_1608 [Nitrosomonas sp. Is79A3]|uniref:hypothetical protein n=1 Tax=Nitrosomonas sp. (strain Is79A3) TaxID=261292 RepID=UPI000215D3D5